MENIFETFEDIGPSISEFIEQDEQNGRLSASVFNLIASTIQGIKEPGRCDITTPGKRF